MFEAADARCRLPGEPRLKGEFRRKHRPALFIADIYPKASPGNSGEDIQRKFRKALCGDGSGLLNADKVNPNVIDDDLSIVARVEEEPGHGNAAWHEASAPSLTHVKD
jgi:hypothetical protein